MNPTKLLSAALFCAIVSSANAQVPPTPAQAQAQINSNIAPNRTGATTNTILNGVLTSVLNASVGHTDASVGNASLLKLGSINGIPVGNITPGTGAFSAITGPIGVTTPAPGAFTAATSFGAPLVPHVTTNAALLASTASATSVVRDGFLAPGDSPPITYVWQPSPCSAPDNGLQVSAANGGCWVANVGGRTLPIGMWGVLPSASGAQNVAGLSAALTAVQAANTGLHLEAGPGKYEFTAQVAANLPNSLSSLTLSGAGTQSTIFDWPSASSSAGIVLTLPPSAETAVFARDIMFSYGGTGGFSGITANQNTLLGAPVVSKFERLLCQGSDGLLQTDYWDSCIRVNGLSNVNFDSITVPGNKNQKGGGIDLNGGSIVDGSPTTFGVIYNISNSSFGTGAWGIRYGGFVQGVTVSNCNFTNGVSGIISPAGIPSNLNQLVLNGNQFNTTGDEVNTSTYVVGFQASNNTFFVNSSATGINLAQNKYFSITGNNRFEAFSGTGAPTNTTGVLIGTTVDKVSVGNISGNSFSALTNGIFLSENSTNVMVGRNAFDFAVNVPITDLGFSNTVEDSRKTYEDSVLVTLGTGGVFTIPMPFTTATDTVANAEPAGVTTLSFASTANIFNNQTVSGTGIPDGERVTATSPTTAALSIPTTAPIAAGTTIAFTNYRFGAPPVVQISNGDTGLQGIAPVLTFNGLQSAIQGAFVGATPGSTARVNIRAIGN